jgi:hypothetical protein
LLLSSKTTHWTCRPCYGQLTLRCTFRSGAPKMGTRPKSDRGDHWDFNQEIKASRAGAHYIAYGVSQHPQPIARGRQELWQGARPVATMECDSLTTA